MRISGTEPSSVILSQTKYFKKLKNDAQKLPKQTKAKRDGVINPQNYTYILYLCAINLEKRNKSLSLSLTNDLFGLYHS